MKISEKEFEVMSSKNSKDRYVYFIKRVVDNEEIWVLDNDGFALCSDDNGNNILMLWPASEYAKVCAADRWNEYETISIKLEYVMNSLLPDLSEKRILVGVFMVTKNSDTPVVNPIDLLLDLKRECRKYE